MACASALAWLLAIGLSQATPAAQPAATPRATAPQVQQAVTRTVSYLQKESADWLHTRKCAACHHVPLPLWALSEAQRQGYAVDGNYVADTIESLLGSKEKLLSSRIFPNPADPPDPRPQGRGLNMGLPMLAVAARSMPALSAGQKQSLQLIAAEIVQKQQADGSWEFFATLRRPPINECQSTDAVWILLALQGETGPEAPPAQRQALAKGMAWLAAAKRPDLHQDRVLKLLLGLHSGKPRAALQLTIDELLALQRADGGWSQTVPDPRSDAFATGQTLYVLSLAGLTAERPEIQRGLSFLVATQQADGSWPMISRSTPNGEPGSAKLLTPITCAASSWATLGLARLVPKEGSAPAAAAGQYLDGRAQTWFAFPGAARGPDGNQTACVSCHTILPYALGRPALRKSTGISAPTEYEQRLIAHVQKRVEGWAQLDTPKFGLYYDFNEQKKKESWGTEAVLNAVILAFDDRYQRRTEPSAATRQAFANLWQVQVRSGDQRGSWDWLNFGLEPWESKGGRYVGAVLAALAVGTAPGYDPAKEDADTKARVELLRGYLRRGFAGQSLHNRAWALWASTQLDGILTPAERKTVIDELFAHQQGDGSWGLAALGPFVRSDGTKPEAAADGYATGLVLHILQTAGVPKADARITRGLAWLKTNQTASGAWPGFSVNKKRDPATHAGKLMTDAATGYAALALGHP